MIFKIEGPVWTDGCNHDSAAYVGSFETLGEKYDLYVFSDEMYGNNVCIRCGNEPSNYASPGGIVGLIQGAQVGMESYKDALELILSLGKIVWKKGVTRYDDEIAILREAGCKCKSPLRGFRPGVSVRCRLCNTVGKRMPTVKDACQVCYGEEGGEPGNENIINGVVMCDYCSAAHKRPLHPDNKTPPQA
jgi:hypothetical protein